MASSGNLRSLPWSKRLAPIGVLAALWTITASPGASAAPTATIPTPLPAVEAGAPWSTLHAHAAQAVGGQILIVEEGGGEIHKLVLDAAGNVLAPWTVATDLVPPGDAISSIERLGGGFAVNTSGGMTPANPDGTPAGPQVPSERVLLADCLDDGTCLYRDQLYDLALRDPSGSLLFSASATADPIPIATKVGPAFHLVYEPTFNNVISRSLAADGTVGTAHPLTFNADHRPFLITPTPVGFTIFASGANDAAFYFLDASGAPVGSPVTMATDPNPCTVDCWTPTAERVGDRIVVRVISNDTNSFVDNGDRLSSRYATFDLAGSLIDAWADLANPIHPAGGTLVQGFFTGPAPTTLTAFGLASSSNGENMLAAGVVGGAWAFQVHRQAAVRYFDVCPAGTTEAWVGQLVAGTSGALELSKVADDGTVLTTASVTLAALDVPRDLTLVEDGTGGVWVLALGVGYDVDTAAIVVRHVDGTGNPVGIEQSWVIDAQEETVDAAKGPGGILVVWHGRDGLNFNDAIKSRTVSDAGVLGAVVSFQDAAPVYLDWPRVAWSGTHYLVAHRTQNGHGVQAYDAGGVHVQSGAQIAAGRYPEIACRPQGCVVQTKLVSDDILATRLWPDGTAAGSSITYPITGWDSSTRPPTIVWDGSAYASLASDTDCFDTVLVPDEIVWLDPVAPSVFSPDLDLFPVSPGASACRYDNRMRRASVAAPLSPGKMLFAESYDGVVQVRLVDNDHVALPAPPPPGGTGGGGGAGGDGAGGTPSTSSVGGAGGEGEPTGGQSGVPAAGGMEPSSGVGGTMDADEASGGV